MYEWIKAFHIISVIFWMAGMLYLPRLYVYHSTAKMDGELDQTLKIQERRLLRIIVNPAMIASLLFGLWMLYLNPALLSGQGWFHVKILLLLILFGYHGFLSKTRKRFEAGERPRSEKFFRIINEVPPITIIFIVILAVVKPL